MTACECLPCRLSWSLPCDAPCHGCATFGEDLPLVLRLWLDSHETPRDGVYFASAAMRWLTGGNGSQSPQRWRELETELQQVLRLRSEVTCQGCDGEGRGSHDRDCRRCLGRGAVPGETVARLVTVTRPRMVCVSCGTRATLLDAGCNCGATFPRRIALADQLRMSVADAANDGRAA